MYVWDVAEIFKTLGGAKGVRELCGRLAPAAPLPAAITVHLWKHRNRISAEWLPVVVRGLVDQDHNLRVFITPLPPSPVPAPASMEDVGL